jgi:hypothetical protein
VSARQDRRDKLASRAVQIGFLLALMAFWYVFLVRLRGYDANPIDGRGVLRAPPTEVWGE